MSSLSLQQFVFYFWKRLKCLKLLFSTASRLRCYPTSRMARYWNALRWTTKQQDFSLPNAATSTRAEEYVRAEHRKREIWRKWQMIEQCRRGTQSHDRQITENKMIRTSTANDTASVTSTSTSHQSYCFLSFSLSFIPSCYLSSTLLSLLSLLSYCWSLLRKPPFLVSLSIDSTNYLPFISSYHIQPHCSPSST